MQMLARKHRRATLRKESLASEEKMFGRFTKTLSGIDIFAIAKLKTQLTFINDKLEY